LANSSGIDRYPIQDQSFINRWIVTISTMCAVERFAVGGKDFLGMASEPSAERRPTSVEPVDVTLRTSGLDVISPPISFELRNKAKMAAELQP